MDREISEIGPWAFHRDWLNAVTLDGGDLKDAEASPLADRLRQSILSGALAPGLQIDLEAVRRTFDAPLGLLREALARLVPLGLVELCDNRDYRVAPVSLGNLAEITQLRVEFESLALSAAIANGDLRWESAVTRALHRLNRAIPCDPADLHALEDWEQLLGEFHAALLAGCGMPLLLNFCLALRDLNDRYRRLSPPFRDAAAAAERNAIAEGAVARDAAFACARLRDHVQRSGDALSAHLATHPIPR